MVSDGVWDRLYRRFMRRLAPIMFPQTSLKINTSTATTNTSAKSSSIISSPQHSTSPKRRLSSGFILTSFTLQANKDRPTSPVSSHSSTLSDDDDNISESELQFLTAFGKNPRITNQLSATVVLLCIQKQHLLVVSIYGSSLPLMGCNLTQTHTHTVSLSHTHCLYLYLSL